VSSTFYSVTRCVAASAALTDACSCPGNIDRTVWKFPLFPHPDEQSALKARYHRADLPLLLIPHLLHRRYGPVTSFMYAPVSANPRLRAMRRMHAQKQREQILGTNARTNIFPRLICRKMTSLGSSQALVSAVGSHQDNAGGVHVRVSSNVDYPLWNDGRNKRPASVCSVT
jgi:hypothetical protein